LVVISFIALCPFLSEYLSANNFATGISLLLFYAFAMQCASTLAITKKETNTWKWPLTQLVFMSGFAYIVALIAFQILK
jgi:ferrous iron transport protein B